jgi:FkbM family methyltransferase
MRRRVSPTFNLLLERSRASLYRLFVRVVKLASGWGIGRRLPIFRRFYFATIPILRPGVTALGPWTVYFHRGDNAVSHALRNEGTYEQFELKLIKCLLGAGDCAIDVGANIGIHSLVMSAAVGRHGIVLALEPDPGNITLLRRNLEVNQCANVELLPIAASDRAERIELFLNPENRGDHRVYDPGDGRSSIMIQTERLDRILEDRQLYPALIKIDVQGWEAKVLAGVVPRLKDVEHLVLVTEFWTAGLRDAGSSDRTYLAMLDDLCLQPYEIDEEERVLRRLPDDRSAWLRIPRETNLLAVRGVSVESLTGIRYEQSPDSG